MRRLDKIDLWEISIVTFPMLPEARVRTVVKRRGMRSGPFDAASFARSLRRGARAMRSR